LLLSIAIPRTIPQTVYLSIDHLLHYHH
jgi:hypothetical protein